MPQDSARTGEFVRVDLIAALEREGKATPVSLDLDDPKMPWSTYAALATFLGHLRNATAWWTGDLLNFGDAVYGFSASQAEALVGRAPETLNRWTWVCRSIPPSRRRVGLSFSHHEVVAKLDPSEQTRLLDLAEAERLNVHEFRGAVQRELSTVESSTSNKSESCESAKEADPTLRSDDDLADRERAAESGGDACPTCGRPFGETPLFDIESAPKGPPS
jgi:hypothetical protein